MSSPNYRYIAMEIGDLIKWDTSVNEINRLATAIFHFQKEEFPSEGITSARAQLVYNWILSLAKQRMTDSERDEHLVSFCEKIVSADKIDRVKKILKAGGIDLLSGGAAGHAAFQERNFHPEVHKHSKKLYLDGHYFHAVFEACKAYNKLVKEKSNEARDGVDLMMRVWAPTGVLKITPCLSETDRDVQNGIKFLSAGLMQAIRNPTSHEPAIQWPISKEDCLNILSFLSFLFKKLDDATFFPVASNQTETP